MLKRLKIFLICFVLLPGFVSAQARQIPAEAKRGTLAGIQGSIAVIDGTSISMSPAAQVRGENNLIIMSWTVPNGIAVKYLLNSDGQIHRIWILTPQEIAMPDAQAR
jgi:hypothetical protein